MPGQLTIGTIKTYDDLGLILLRDFELSPPSPKTYIVDIPGGDGHIDLSEYSGDVAYSNRTQVFEFDVATRNVETTKTKLSNLLHGKAFDYALSWDPGYTYHGRFTVSSYEDRHCEKMRIKLTVDADPYKSKGELTWLVNAAGGVEVLLPCGRKRQCPTFEVQRKTLINFGGTTYVFEAGAYIIRDLYLAQGDNTIIINTYPDYGSTKWTSYLSKKWSEISSKRWAQVAAGTSPVQVPSAWNEYAASAWVTLAAKRWIELAHPAIPGDEYSAYVNYEWKDL